MDDQHEPNWDEVEQLGRHRMLCAQCIAQLLQPNMRVLVHYREGAEDVGGGSYGLQRARRAAGDGHPVEGPAGGFLGVFADTTVHGTAVCAHHLHDLAGRRYLFG